MSLEMLDVILSVTGGFVLLVMMSLIRRKKVTNYHLPPGPKRNLVFGNLMDLIYSSMITGEPSLLKFAKWSFQVTSFTLKLLFHSPLCAPPFSFFETCGWSCRSFLLKLWLLRHTGLYSLCRKNKIRLTCTERGSTIKQIIHIYCFTYSAGHCHCRWK